MRPADKTGRRARTCKPCWGWKRRETGWKPVLLCSGSLRSLRVFLDDLFDASAGFGGQLGIGVVTQDVVHFVVVNLGRLPLSFLFVVTGDLERAAGLFELEGLDFLLGQ